MSSRTIAAVVWLAMLAGLTGCSREKPAAAPAPEVVRGVAVRTVEMGRMEDAASAEGTVRALQTADVASQTMGNLAEVRVREGDRVRRGQVLAVVDDAQPQAGARQAKAAEDAAREQATAAATDLALAEATLKRYQSLYERKSVSAQEFDEVKARAQAARAHQEMARAQQAQAQAGVAQAHTSLDYTRLRAPFDGVVTARRLDAGAYVGPGVPVFTMEGGQRFRLEVSVNEGDLRYVREGQSVAVRMDAVADAPVMGKVAQILPSADAASRSFLVKIDLPQDARLRSGVFGRAEFSRGERQALLVPRAAVVDRGQLQGVFVVGANQVASLRYITVGKAAGELVEVLAGLQSGERIVAAPGAVDLNGRKIEAGQ